MAVKFSDFTQVTDTQSSSVTNLVGFESSGELNIKIAPSALDTTYTYNTTNGASPALTLAGAKAGFTIADQIVTLSGAGATVLAGTGTNAISFTSTAYALTATDNANPAVNTPLVLTGTGGGDAGTDTVNIIGSGGIQVTSSSNVITINDSTSGSGVTDFTNSNDPASFVQYGQVNSSATGSVTIGGINLTAGTPSSPSTEFLRGDNTWAVPAGGYLPWSFTADTGTNETVASGAAVTFAGGTIIATVASSPDTLTVNHSAVTRSDTTSSDSPAGGGTVDLVKTITTSTEGHVTAVDVSTVTWPAAGGGTFNVATTTGTGSNDTLALGVSPPSDDNVQLYIDGVYQSKSAYTVTGSNLTLDGGVFFPNGSAVEATTIT